MAKKESEPVKEPKPVLEPLFVPTLPVTCEMLVLIIAPSVENNAKLAAVPKLID